MCVLAEGGEGVVQGGCLLLYIWETAYNGIRQRTLIAYLRASAKEPVNIVVFNSHSNSDRQVLL